MIRTDVNSSYCARRLVLPPLIGGLVLAWNAGKVEDFKPNIEFDGALFTPFFIGVAAYLAYFSWCVFRVGSIRPFLAMTKVAQQTGTYSNLVILVLATCGIWGGASVLSVEWYWSSSAATPRTILATFVSDQNNGSDRRCFKYSVLLTRYGEFRVCKDGRGGNSMREQDLSESLRSMSLASGDKLQLVGKSNDHYFVLDRIVFEPGLRGNRPQ